MAVKKGLGKGLDALFLSNNSQENGSIQMLAISEIEPNKDQPRKEFDPEAMAELVSSIKEHGILQPLLVRPSPHGTYLLVAGERRWRAAKLAGLSEVPVYIKQVDDRQQMEMALVENLQRQDLNPIEEARGYKTLIDTYSITQDELAQRVGKSRSAITNSLRLLSLPGKVREQLINRSISAGHARALAAIQDSDEIIRLADRIINEKLSVRETEKLVQQSASKPQDTKTSQKAAKKDRFLSEVEIALTNELNRKIVIEGSQEKGKLIIEYYSKSDLASLAELLSSKNN